MNYTNLLIEMQQCKTPLGITLEEFQDRWNKQCEAYGKEELKLSEIDINDVTSVVKIKINKNLAFVGTLAKDNNNICYLTLMGSGDGSVKSGTNIMSSIGIMIMVIRQETDTEARSEIMTDLGLLSLESKELNKETTLDGLKYKVRVSQREGVSFSVSK
ncbi:hypothetical protein [Priestia megaterium]|uniref:hypothetical protein n=1 Tax=Priestia megaterium TaxID=1404 RepID=UPI0027953406|nr:hypothetical protein [Priestia megaterium]